MYKKIIALAVCWLVFQPTTAGAVSQNTIDIAWGEANRINNHKLNYVWGGGHTKIPSGPKAQARRNSGYDCSGAISRILYVSGLIKQSRVSTSYLNWGKRGSGKITIYVTYGHVFMGIRRGTRTRFFGTSPQNPGGGAGFFRPSKRYRAGFIKRQP